MVYIKKKKKERKKKKRKEKFCKNSQFFTNLFIYLVSEMTG